MNPIERQPRHLRRPFLISFLLSALGTLFTLVVYFPLQPVVPLFYSLARPEQHLVAKEWIFLLPAISWVISLGHLSLAKLMRNADLILIKMFVWTTVVMQVVLTIALLRIILIVI